MSFAGVLAIGLVVSCDSGGSATQSGSISVGGPGATNEGSDTSGSGVDVNLEVSYANDIFTGINSVRVSAGGGRVALIRDAALDAIAAGHNATMISAASPFGAIQTGHANVQSRADSVFDAGYNGFAENTGGIRGYASSEVPSEFVDGWVNSAGHYQNIIGDYTHSGIAVTVDTRDGTVYSTQIFARLP